MNPISNELKNFLIYSNASPVSYFLNGFNTAIVMLGGKSSCKSRLLVGGEVSLETASNESIVCQLANEILRYAEHKNSLTQGNHPAYTVGLSLADIVYSDADKTEILTDLLRVQANDNKNADLDLLTNLQITYSSFRLNNFVANTRSSRRRLWSPAFRARTGPNECKAGACKPLCSDGEYQILPGKSHSIVKFSQFQQKSSQLSNLVVVDCVGFRVDNTATAM
jgi:hypothetical protein